MHVYWKLKFLKKMINIKDTATFHFKAYSYFSSYPLKQPIFCTSLTKRSLKPLKNFCTNKIDRGVDQNKDQRLGNPFYKFLIETMRHEALQLWAECHVCMQKKLCFTVKILLWRVHRFGIFTLVCDHHFQSILSIAQLLGHLLYNVTL